MSEIILGLIVIALIGVIVWEKREHKKETSKFINALISKTSEQYRDLELTEKVKPIRPPQQTEPEFTLESEVSDKKFEEMIKREIA